VREEGEARFGDDVGEDGVGDTGGDSLGLLCPLCPLYPYGLPPSNPSPFSIIPARRR